MTDPGGTRRAAPCAVALGALLVAACAAPRPPGLNDSVRERLSVLGAERLAERSSEAPQTPGTAREDVEPRLRTPAPPPAQLALTLHDVRKATLENNLSLRVALVSPAIARETFGEQSARFEPLLFGSASVTGTDTPGVSASAAQNELGVTLPLRTGGEARVSFGSESLDSGLAGSDTVTGTALSLSISQPLLRGAGIADNNATVMIAELQASQELARTKLTVNQVLAAAEVAYWRYYAAERALEIRHQQYQRALLQHRQAKQLAERGVVARIEITRARAGVSRRVEDIIVADNARRAAERDLKRIMNRPGLGMESPTALLTRTEPRPFRYTLDTAALAAEAVGERMEMLELALQLSVDDISVDSARDGELPALGLDYRFSYLGTDNGFASSLDALERRDSSETRLGAVLEVPIGNEAANARRRRAQLQRSFTLATREQRALAIRQQVLDVADDLEDAWQRIAAAREETLFATRSYDAESKQFLAGIRTSTDVLQAADFLADAQLREVQALAAYETAKVDLAVATGKLPGGGDVRIVPDAGPGGQRKPFSLRTRAEADAVEPSAQMLSRVSALLASAQAPAPAINGRAFPAPAPIAAPAPEPAPRDPAAGRPAAAQMDPGAYTIQVLGGVSARGATAFADRHRLGERAAFARQDGDGGETHYAVLYGEYPSYARAAAALRDLPPALAQAGPWIRRVSEVHARLVARPR